MPTDVSKRDQVERLADTTLRHFGASHIVCNDCASKFAVVGLSEALHRELDPHGIGVSVLCPMIVDTNISENSVRTRPPHLRPTQAPPPLPPAGSMQGGTVTAAEVAARVERAIESKRLYVLTHPEQQEILRRRAVRLERAFDAWDPQP